MSNEGCDYHKMDDYSMGESTSDSEVEMRRLLKPLHDNDDGNADDNEGSDNDDPCNELCPGQCLRSGINNNMSSINNNMSNNDNDNDNNNTSSSGNNSSRRSYLENDVDETNIQEQLFSTLNQIEDNLDEHTYKEIVPLSIRIQLENQVFGWTHLCSIFMGHLFYTLSAYFAVFWLVSYLGLKHVRADTDDSDSDNDNSDGRRRSFKGCAWQCFVDKVFYNGHGTGTGTDTDTDTDTDSSYLPIMSIPPLLFLVLRILVSLSSALSAFRTVRRRTMVWLHSPTSKNMRRSIMETDRTTLMGRIRSGLAKKRNVWVERRNQRKIKKASSRFERRHQRRKRRRKLSDGITLFEGNHHDRVLRLGNTTPNRHRHRTKPHITIIGQQNLIRDDDSQFDSYSHSGGNNNNNNNNSNSNNSNNSNSNSNNNSNNNSRHQNHLRRRRITRTKSLSCSVLDPGDFLETFQKYEGRGAYNNSHDTHFTGHTMPASAMQSVLQDQIRFKHGLVHNVPYAHGGYFGAAPFMLANPHWINILRCLMPDVYVEISQRVVHAPIPKLIHWAENNPVMAAYGTAHDLEYHGKVPTLEWDIFLDPHLVQRIEIVLDARNEILDRLQNTSKKTAASNKRFSERTNAVEKLLTPHELSILGFFNTEIKKRVNVLVENMLIAHGNGSQLVLEQTGYLKQYNFSRVRHMRRTLGGGISSLKWITIYVEALRMSTNFGEKQWSDDDGSQSETSYPSRNKQNSSSPSKARANKGDNLGESVSLLHNTDVSDLDDHSLKVNSQTPIDDDNTSDEQEYAQNISTKTYKTSTQSTSIADSIAILKGIMNCEAPLGLLLDIKSRHVPKRIWALVVDALREAGARVEGIGSFVTQEIRDISQLCSAPVTELVLVHTAGDLQKACHDGSIQRGESVFFNGGSLFYNFPDLKDIKCLMNMITTSLCRSFDAKTTKRNYKFESFARVARRQVSDGELVGIPESCHSAENSGDMSASSDEKIFPIPRKRNIEQPLKFKEGYGSTIEQYKDHFELSIGIYVQEFAIDEKSIDMLVKYVNENSRVFNLGLGWGGINGVTVRGIQPGRFTHTDGLWNQRYTGHRWNTEKFPTVM